jgi:peptidoglycan/xylan/chitin deacetylase (PgdA/CDA1 family)
LEKRRSEAWLVKPISLMKPVRKLARPVLPLAESTFGSIKSVSTTDPVIALTFDDGPSPEHLPAILDVLDRHRARATFFLIAHRARSHPDLAREIAARGHEVGLHGLDHLPLRLLTSREVKRRVWQGRRELERILDSPVTLFRPPFGGQSLRTYLITRSAGMQVVGWTAMAGDWLELPIDEIAAKGVDALEPGGILVLHDHVEVDVRNPAPPPSFDRAAMVDLVLTRLGERGLRAESVSGLMAGRVVRRTLWFWD